MLLFSLVFMRMSGFVLLNPVLGRRNVPAVVKSAFIMVLTLAIYAFSSTSIPVVNSSLELGVLLLKEFAVGYFVGFTMELFMMVISFAGSIIDFQMGMSMATVYDPQSNAQMAISGSLWNAYFMMLFFAVDGHLALMKILITSSHVIPYGEVAISSGAAIAMLDIFCQCILLGVKFSFPIIAIEFLTEIAVGILMKVIPQINVFVVNIQAKILIGFLMMLFLFSPMTDFLGDTIAQMMRTIQQVLKLLH